MPILAMLLTLTIVVGTSGSLASGCAILRDRAWG